MTTKVKILDFNRRSMKVEEAENALADLIEQGYSLVSQSESNGFLSYTLVKDELNVLMYCGDGGIPAHKYATDATYTLAH